MEVFRDLHISADADRMASAVEQMERLLPAGWTRDRTAEERARVGGVKPRVTYCFTCTKEGHRPAAILILAQKDPETFYVSNIIPRERHQLAHNEYNTILEDFYQRVFRPYADKSGLVNSMTDSEAGLDRWM